VGGFRQGVTEGVAGFAVAVGADVLFGGGVWMGIGSGGVERERGDRGGQSQGRPGGVLGDAGQALQRGAVAGHCGQSAAAEVIQPFQGAGGQALAVADPSDEPAEPGGVELGAVVGESGLEREERGGQGTEPAGLFDGVVVRGWGRGQRVLRRVGVEGGRGQGVREVRGGWGVVERVDSEPVRQGQ
jgi:hypothetical protein